MRIYAPIQKSDINIAKRTVTGIAQIEDAPDHHNDVVDFEGSKRAFGKWVGNIREMHAKKAVGSCVSWSADPIAKAIRVTAKISHGAEDTWQKVLDGTLKGFSIGGHELAAERRIDKSTGRTYNRIIDYVLTELSLVDSPANPSCVITAITKRRGVLERTSVLDPLSGGNYHMSIKKAVGALRGIAKTLGDNDDIIILRKSDMTLNADGSATLNKNALPGVITKDDAGDAGLMSDSDDVDPGDMGGVDLEGHATNMANAHKDLCGMQGIDHMQHYADATDDDQNDPADQGGGDPASGGGDIEMSRRTGNLRKSARSTNASLDRRIEKAVGNRMTSFEKRLDDVLSKFGSQPMPRKGEEGGAPIAKTLESVLGTSPAGVSTKGGLAERYESLEKSLADLRDKARPIIAKADAGHKLSAEEDTERIRIGKAMGPIEVEMGEIRRVAQVGQ